MTCLLVRLTYNFSPITINNEQDVNASHTSEDEVTGNDCTALLHNLDAAYENAIESQDVSCIFCKKKRKCHRRREEQLHTLTKSSTIDNLEKTARELKQLDFERKIKRLRDSDEILYHRFCKKSYECNLTRAKNTDDTEWHEARNKHQKAFWEVCRFVSDNIVENQEIYYLSFLHSLYMKHLTGNSLDRDSYFGPYHLGQKLIKEFGNKISFKKIGGKKVVKPIKVVLLESDIIKIDERDIMCRAALIEQNRNDIPNFLFYEKSTRKRKREDKH